MTRRSREGTIRAYGLAALACLVVAPAPAPATRSNAAAAPPPFDAPVGRPPLAGALVVNGGFGDYRGGHFHAGFDFGTARRVGRPVVAPADGRIERARASGAGYGRSLYVRLEDGRLLQFGHLDAFAGPVGAYVQHVQDSTGLYEQDLWPPPGRFPVRAGATIAWTGESGAGGPHLHFEIRRGDTAYNPRRAGLPVADGVAPALLSLTLEPLDDSSTVAGRSGPYTIPLARPDTIRAFGRLRAVVAARDRSRAGDALVAPWSVGIEWNGASTECRFDSLSWASDMADAEYVYDAGRVVGRKGLVLWAPAGFRPRALATDAPAGGEAGTIVVRPGDPPRPLRVRVRDLAGRESSSRVWLVPGAPPAPASAAWWRGDAARGDDWGAPGLAFTSLPGGSIRIAAPLRAATHGPDIQVGAHSRRATRTADGWSATLALPESAAPRAARIPIAVRPSRATSAAGTGGGHAWVRRGRGGEALALADSSRGHRLALPAGTLFEDASILAFPATSGESKGLVPIGAAWRLEPASLPLRRAATVLLTAPAGASLDRVGLYRSDAGTWQWVGATRDSVARTVSGASRRLGRFALFRDETAPKAALREPAPPPAPSNRGPYSRWALEATVRDEGSGVDATASWIEVDGRRVPTEWDAEAGRLRWRPAAPPAAGAHDVIVVAADRAGNVARLTGRFRIAP
ncbi:MAG TPA: M23 family metallopeptidase [Candidatus Eisenbacteria bacterium]|nr:M23 family metallopeptidase [Candidatus Eisenbacteria bacterium]